MRAFVSGGSGFIGSNLVDRLLRQGHEVTVYDLVANNMRPGLTLITGDLLDAYRLTESLKGHDIVFHLAANADIRFGTTNTTRDLNQNVLATSNVLEAMRTHDIQRIVFSSTSIVYGEPTIFPTPEDSPFPIQTSFYGASKVAAEALISAYCTGFGIRATIFRFVPVLGEGYKHGHVYDFCQKLQADRTQIELLGDGQQQKSMIYIGDVLDAIDTVICRPVVNPVDIFNVGTDYTITIDQSLDVICEVLDVNPIRTYTGGIRGWVGDSPYILLDCSRLRALGWQPKVSIDDAIAKTVRSFT